MLANKIYTHLENDFIKPGISDDFYKYMPELEPFLCDNFKNRSIGLMCDFTETINHVFTAVFPTENVIQKVLNNGKNTMIFLHHACNWDLNRSPHGFYNMDASLLEMLKDNQISLFCLHHPLDNYSEYSTSKTLADALDIDIIRPFVEFSGAVCGVIGNSKYKTVNKLQKKYSEVVGHETKLYQYGQNEILDNKVAVVAGGGNAEFVVHELIENKIKLLITGLTLKNDISAGTHELEKNNQINIIGGTHYSSEKFACVAMCKYFEKLGLPAEFIEDEPCFEDM